jgi:hypothetical protein
MTTLPFQEPIKRFDGLFDLYQDEDGSYRCEFGKDTSPIELSLRWKLTQEETALIQVLVSVASGMAEMPLPLIKPPKIVLPLGGSNVFEIHQEARQVQAHARLYQTQLTRLQTALGADLQSLTAGDKAQQKRLPSPSNSRSNTF